MREVNELLLMNSSVEENSFANELPCHLRLKEMSILFTYLKSCVDKSLVIFILCLCVKEVESIQIGAEGIRCCFCCYYCL